MVNAVNRIMNNSYKLKNIYNDKDIVYCNDLKNIKRIDNNVFIWVYKKETPNKQNLVNLAAYQVCSKYA